MAALDVLPRHIAWRHGDAASRALLVHNTGSSIAEVFIRPPQTSFFQIEFGGTGCPAGVSRIAPGERRGFQVVCELVDRKVTNGRRDVIVFCQELMAPALVRLEYLGSSGVLEPVESEFDLGPPPFWDFSALIPSSARETQAPDLVSISNAHHAVQAVESGLPQTFVPAPVFEQRNTVVFADLVDDGSGKQDVASARERWDMESVLTRDSSEWAAYDDPAPDDEDDRPPTPCPEDFTGEDLFYVEGAGWCDSLGNVVSNAPKLSGAARAGTVAVGSTVQQKLSTGASRARTTEVQRSAPDTRLTERDVVRNAPAPAALRTVVPKPIPRRAGDFGANWDALGGI